MPHLSMLRALCALALAMPAARAAAQPSDPVRAASRAMLTSAHGSADDDRLTWYPRRNALSDMSGIRWSELGLAHLSIGIGRDALVFGLSAASPALGSTNDVAGGDPPVVLGHVDAAALVAADSAFVVARGGSSLFRVNVDGAATFGGTYDGDGSGANIPVDGAGTRMMWYPRKGAFRAGGVAATQWDAANIGDYSVAIGQDVRASASNAIAFGLRTTAAQQASFAAGEDNTASGAASVALGYHAHTNARQGAFVFSDRSSVDTLRAGVNHSANWRVSGGFRIFTSSNLSTGVTIQSGAAVSNWGQPNAVISTSTGAYLSTAGVWTNTSDVRRKHRFEDVSGEAVLARLRAMPIRTWTYKVEPDGVRHMGPTAQDFLSAFGLGTDSATISTVDEGGVALASAQALEARTTSQAAELRALRAENDSLRARLGTIEERLARLESRRRKP